MALNIQAKNPLLIERGSPLVATFNESLLPGKTYQVEVKTISGSVPSWPANGTVTTRPLPVQNLRQVVDENTGEVRFKWDPHPESQQDSYRVGTFTICKNCASLTFNVSEAAQKIWYILSPENADFGTEFNFVV